MKVRRIVTDLPARDPKALALFYEELFGFETQMDAGFIATVGSGETGQMQLSLISEGGSGAPSPAMSVEVDDLDEALARAKRLGAEIAYGPAQEPWGVRRFFLRDPGGNLINILTHERAA